MTFLNFLGWPLFALSLIPIVVHLINRKRVVDRRFPPFDFLMKIDATASRSLNLQSLLLLLIRMLILAVALFMLMQPVLYSGHYKDVERSGRIIVVLDASMSMRLISRGVSGYRAGLSFIGKYVEREGIKEVVILSHGLENRIIKLNGYAGEFSEKTANMEPSYGSSPLETPIREALKIAKAEGTNDKIFIVSDFYAHSLEMLPDSLFWGHPSQIIFCNTADSHSVNIGITNVAVERSGDGTPVALKALNSSGNDIADWPLQLYLGNKLVTSLFVDIKANSELNKRVLLSGYEMAEKGFVRQKTDSLVEDDVRYFVFNPPKSVAVLIVDGDQAANLVNAESYYFERALSTDKSMTIKVVPHMIIDNRLLEGYNVLCLLNYVPDIQSVKVIERFIKNGNGLFVTLGNKVDVDLFNAKMGKLTGVTLRERKAGYGKKFAEAESFALPFAAHPAVMPISELRDGSNYLFRNLFLVDPNPDKTTETLMRLVSGDPVLLCRESNNGRILVFLSSIDMEWNNFPLRPFFLPFAHGVVSYLALSGNNSKQYNSITCGDSIIIKAKSASVIVYDPLGVRHVLSVRDGLAPFYETFLPGHYVVQDGSAPAIFISVNTPPKESDLKMVADEKLKRITAGSSPVFVPIRYSKEAEVSLPRPLWYVLLSLVLILMLIESLIAREWRGKRDD